MVINVETVDECACATKEEQKAHRSTPIYERQEPSTSSRDHPPGQLIHLTEDNINSLRQEISEVREALTAKYPDEAFPRILPHLNPDRILPNESLFEKEITDSIPERQMYGPYGRTLRADRLPYCVFLAKFIGIQCNCETPFIEELLMWVYRIVHHDDIDDNDSQHELPNCRNSQWRYEYFRKRRNLLKKKLIRILQKEIMDLLMVTRQYKDGSLIQETGFFSFYMAFIQRKMLSDGNKDD